MLKIHPISIPTPFLVGDVWVYLIEDRKRILIDCGPKTTEAFVALTKGVEKVGCTLSSIDELWITHAHPDHYGQATLLQNKYGITLVGPGKEVKGFNLEEDYHLYRTFFLEHGISEEWSDFFHSQYLWYGNFIDPIQLDKEVYDGDKLSSGDHVYGVYELPGHSVGHVSYVHCEDKFAFGGDVLLNHISSNALIAFNPDTGERLSSLELLRNSMRRLSSHAHAVYPGHGAMFTHPPTVVKKHFAQHKQRYSKILQALHEPKTLLELTIQLFPSAGKMKYAYLPISEVVGYLDWACSLGEIERIKKNNIYYFSLV